VAELDGVWKVERLSGLLPPLVAVRKRISGSSGHTTVGPFPAAPFVVEGYVLHYKPPFGGFVDFLEPDGGGYRGRATFRGRQFATFRLTRQ
jgi:hypothetical protein